MRAGRRTTTATVDVAKGIAFGLASNRQKKFPNFWSPGAQPVQLNHAPPPTDLIGFKTRSVVQTKRA